MSDIFKITWKVDDGYANNGPQSSTISADEIEDDMDETDLRELFNDYLEDEFKNKVSFSTADEDAFVEWAKGLELRD